MLMLLVDHCKFNRFIGIMRLSVYCVFGIYVKKQTDWILFTFLHQKLFPSVVESVIVCMLLIVTWRRRSSTQSSWFSVFTISVANDGSWYLVAADWGHTSWTTILSCTSPTKYVMSVPFSCYVPLPSGQFGIVITTLITSTKLSSVKPWAAQLVLGLVTTFGGSTIPVFDRPTQPGHSSVGRFNDYWRCFGSLKETGSCA